MSRTGKRSAQGKYIKGCAPPPAARHSIVATVLACEMTPMKSRLSVYLDPALMMQLGAETVFVGSGIFMKERATPLSKKYRYDSVC